MSGHDKSHNDHGHGHGAEDEIAYGKVIGVGVVSLAVFALSIFWSARVMSSRVDETEAKTGKAKSFDMTRSEIGIVDQVPFVIDKRLHRWKAEHAARLNGYGWIDRSKGIAHVPIDQAMEAVAGGALPAGAPR